ncbi:response regulator [Phyllobacterium brassicacearum]|uniref:Response regulator n=2 Tax=Phyllobacterium brassicacearum TaxID=314235 RepID=A0A2P7B2V9_9HYPH|nr:response regulator [Phyllobacterium brassicacearum]
MTISDYLRDCDFTVIEGGSADEAISLLQSGIHVDLVFSDVKMPGDMDGFGLANWIREHQPGIKVVILTSGYANAAEIAAELCEESPIAKPYDHQHNLERIQQALGKGQPLTITSISMMFKTQNSMIYIASRF